MQSSQALQASPGASTTFCPTLTRVTTWPSLGSGTSGWCSTSGPPCSEKTMAFIAVLLCVLCGQPPLREDSYLTTASPSLSSSLASLWAFPGDSGRISLRNFRLFSHFVQTPPGGGHSSPSFHQPYRARFPELSPSLWYFA